MPYGRKIILHCPHGYQPNLPDMVEQFVSDGVVFVGVVGQDCAKIEDIIDECVIGDGSDNRPLVLTSSHPNESIEDAVEFAMLLTGEFAGEVQIVTL